ncbi:MAG: sigma-70 family RNA polymerase sigma factor [Acidobacteriota bacterium]
MMTATAPAPPPADIELIESSRHGDADAFAQLVDRYKDRLVNYLTRLVGDPERAEDLAQETFVRLWRQLEHYRDEGVLAAYLYRIATNLVRSEARRQRRWRQMLPQINFSSDVTSSSESGPQSMTLASEAQRQVRRALARLNLELRAPLVLREIEGLTYPEIAALLELPEGTVKSRIHRGRKRLERHLAAYWHGDSPSAHGDAS